MCAAASEPLFTLSNFISDKIGRICRSDNIFVDDNVGDIFADVLYVGEMSADTKTVMWSETVGLRTRPVSDQKMVLVLQVWCCVVKHGLVTLVVIMILKETTTFQVLLTHSLFCAWNIATVEINSGVHLLKN